MNIDVPRYINNIIVLVQNQSDAMIITISSK